MFQIIALKWSCRLYWSVLAQPTAAATTLYAGATICHARAKCKFNNSVVCTLIDNDTCHYSGQNVVDPAPWTHWPKQRGMDSYRQRQIIQSDCEISSNCGKIQNWHHLSILAIVTSTPLTVVYLGWSFFEWWQTLQSWWLQKTLQ